jgi:hypothetical protein
MVTDEMPPVPKWHPMFIALLYVGLFVSGWILGFFTYAGIVRIAQ